MSRAAAIGIAASFALSGCASPDVVPPAAPRPIAAPSVPTATPPAPVVVTFANAGFEAGMKPEGRCAVGWDCTMHNNPESFRFSLLESGAAAERRSLCVERVLDEPWALVTQASHSPQLRGKRLRLSMQVRVEGATGAGAGPWILAHGRPVANATQLVKGTAGWQRLAVELAAPADSVIVQFGATLEGPGRACFDDVRLDVL